jgi:hypothetical protein
MRASQNTIETISTIGIDVGKDKPDVLDPAGGTDIFHMAPGRVKLTAGTDAMRCLSLSNKVLRWYTECCRTPIANTRPWAGFPGHRQWFIPSWTTGPTVVPETRCSVRPLQYL